MHSKPLNLFIAIALMLMWGISCSDDTSNTKQDGSVDAAQQDSKVTADTAPEAALPDLTPDSTVAGCNEKDVGKACTKGGSECGSKYTCVLTSAAKGYCSCTCTEDNPLTAMVNEDTCPGSLFCASYTASGATAAKPYCFKAIGGSKSSSSSWQTVSDINTPEMITARRTPTSYPFNVLGVGYKLMGSYKYCATELAHTVAFFVGTAKTPAASPMVNETVSVPLGAAPADMRHVSTFLKIPVILTSGQNGFPIIQLATDTTKNKGLCIMAQSASSATAEIIFKAKEAAAPFTWQASKGSDSHIMLLGF